MPRQARLDAPGTLHHVIVRGIEKRRIVDDKVDQDNFVLREELSANNLNILRPSLSRLRGTYLGDNLNNISC